MTKLEDVLKDFHQRISAIEKQLHQEGRPVKTEQTAAAKARTYEKVASSKPYSGTTEVAFDSSSMLAFIGIAFVILAGVFFIKLTIDSGWLTPVRQVLLAAATGLVFFFTPQ